MGIRSAVLSSLLVPVLVTGVVAWGVSCKKNEAQTKKTPAASGDQAASAAKATDMKDLRLQAKVAPTPGTEGPSANITWIEDDFAGAMAAAKKANKPLVVDMWAPWCHTCLSMKSTVLKDPGLAEHADRFVWVGLDTDKAINAAALEKLPVSAWPTFFVVAPDESIAARFLGSASVKQFRGFLDQGEKAARAGDASLEKGTAAWHLRDGDRNASAGNMKKAAAAYAAALEVAPAAWPRRADVLVAQISALHKAGDKKACAELGLARISDTIPARSASTADFSYYATSCAKDAGDKAHEDKVRAVAIESIEGVLADASAHLSADDRSDAMRILRDELEAGGHADRAKAMAEKQRAVLDQAAEAAANPFFAMTYNWPRSEVYVYLGKGAELIADLEKSAADLPKEYDPPYRLAWVLYRLERTKEALAAVESAEKLAYGPRKGRVLALKADIIAAGGDAAATRKAREAVLAHYQSLPAGQKSDGAIAAAKKALAETK